jgi:hypothetical protein
VIIASTEKGICHLAFADDRNEADTHAYRAISQSRIHPTGRSFPA